jgi:hypothetical protein
MSDIVERLRELASLREKQLDTHIHALIAKEAEIERLRGLLREAIDKPFTLGRQSTIDAWQVVWSERVREALGDE